MSLSHSSLFSCPPSITSGVFSPSVASFFFSLIIISLPFHPSHHPHRPQSFLGVLPSPPPSCSAALAPSLSLKPRISNLKIVHKPCWVSDDEADTLTCDTSHWPAVFLLCTNTAPVTVKVVLVWYVCHEPVSRPIFSVQTTHVEKHAVILIVTFLDLVLDYFQDTILYKE